MLETNYQKMLKILDNVKANNFKPKLLLHCCCAPCTSSVLKKLSDYFDITLFYYNPNIYPFEEFEKRRIEFDKLKSIANFDFIVPSYDHNEFLTFAKDYSNENEGGKRCTYCFDIRLKKTFEYAKLNKFDYVATTLTVSPYKPEKLINEIGSKYENDTNVKYLPSDFKKDNGYLNSINICKELNIYRQNYCGCEFSKNEI